MRCPTLNDLPPPPVGKAGWPWTVECPRLPERMADGSPWPLISIVTPSFNQARYLEETLRSVLLQGYPSLEYIVIDGGSSDGSVDIIKRYRSWLSKWVAEPDRGQTDAINKGLRAATGEWVTWQNSDDIFCPGAFAGLARATVKEKKAQLVIGNVLLIDEHSHGLRDVRYVRPTHKALLAEGMVLTNQAAFWRRSVHDDIGLLDEQFQYGFDYEWFLRLTKNRQAIHVNKLWGGYRLHDQTKSARLDDLFKREHRKILAGREIGPWQKRLYMLRRLILLAINGEFAYLMRGIYERFGDKRRTDGRSKA